MGIADFEFEEGRSKQTPNLFSGKEGDPVPAGPFQKKHPWTAMPSNAIQGRPTNNKTQDETLLVPTINQHPTSSTLSEQQTTNGADTSSNKQSHRDIDLAVVAVW